MTLTACLAGDSWICYGCRGECICAQCRKRGKSVADPLPPQHPKSSLLFGPVTAPMAPPASKPSVKSSSSSSSSSRNHQVHLEDPAAVLETLTIVAPNPFAKPFVPSRSGAASSAFRGVSSQGQRWRARICVDKLGEEAMGMCALQRDESAARLVMLMCINRLSSARFIFSHSPHAQACAEFTIGDFDLEEEAALAYDREAIRRNKCKNLNFVYKGVNDHLLDPAIALPDAVTIAGWQSALDRVSAAASSPGHFLVRQAASSQPPGSTVPLSGLFSYGGGSGSSAYGSGAHSGMSRSSSYGIDGSSSSSSSSSYGASGANSSGKTSKRGPRTKKSSSTTASLSAHWPATAAGGFSSTSSSSSNSATSSNSSSSVDLASLSLGFDCGLGFSLPPAPALPLPVSYFGAVADDGPYFPAVPATTVHILSFEHTGIDTTVASAAAPSAVVTSSQLAPAPLASFIDIDGHEDACTICKTGGELV